MKLQTWFGNVPRNLLVNKNFIHVMLSAPCYDCSVLNILDKPNKSRNHASGFWICLVKSKNRPKLKCTKVKQSFHLRQSCNEAPRLYKSILYIIAILWPQLAIVSKNSACYMLIVLCIISRIIVRSWPYRIKCIEVTFVEYKQNWIELKPT